MDLDIVVSTLLPIALAAIMLSLGLGLVPDDFKRILEQPKAFGIGAACQLVLIPTVAYGLVVAFGFSGELALGIMILSFCPGGPTANILTKYARGDLALAISLTGSLSLVAILTVPILVALSSEHFLGVEAPPLNVGTLGFAMFAITAVPVGLGMGLRALAPRFAARIEPILDRVSLVLFVVVIVTAIAANLPLLRDNLLQLAPLLVVLNLILLFAGLAIARAFGLTKAQSTAIGVETGIQNATLGITIGSLIAEQASGLPPFSLPSAAYGLVMYAISVPFVLWRRRLAGSPGESTSAPRVRPRQA